MSSSVGSASVVNLLMLAAPVVSQMLLSYKRLTMQCMCASDKVAADAREGRLEAIGVTGDPATLLSSRYPLALTFLPCAAPAS